MYLVRAAFAVFFLPFVLNDKISDHKRFLSLFSIVRFENGPCSASTSGEPRNGTCLTSSECTSAGGTASGSCAGGFGVCCVVEKGCDTESSLNSTYWTASFTGTGTCSFTVIDLPEDVCQVRLDFEEFSLNQPTAGNCDQDIFTAQGLNLGTENSLCGENAGQHVYLHVGRKSGDIKLKVKSTSEFSSRNWRILVSHIPCDSPVIAPPGCVQYYFQDSGKIKSFNFPDTEATVQRHLNQKSYGICFRPEDEAETLKLTQCAGNPRSFTLSGSSTAALTGVVDTCDTTDALIIPCGSTSAALALSECRNNQFCGGLLTAGTPATTSSSVYAPLPTVLRFIANDNDASPDAENNGFCLDFVQV